MDCPGYIKPDLQDFLLTDINVRVIATKLEVDYLRPAAFPRTFPVMGRIQAPNHRLMAPLVCRRQVLKPKQVSSVNNIFVINTVSPVTYICQEAMEALIGKDIP